MKHLAVALLLAAVWVGSAAPPASTAQPEPATAVSAIIEKALERSAWAEEQEVEARYRHARVQRTRKFDKHDEVTTDETRLYRVEPVRGVPYAQLISKNGAPIEGDDLNTERKRRHDFLEALDKDPDESDEKDEEDDDTEILFNEELLGRYTARLDGVRELRGRPSYVLSFEPKPGKLPVRRRIDYALNKSRGEIWIDQATHEVARVNFELMERVRLWWGILGSISKATGRFERKPVAEDAWMATEFDIYYQLRVLFSTTRRGETTLWRDFEPVAE